MPLPSAIDKEGARLVRFGGLIPNNPRRSPRSWSSCGSPSANGSLGPWIISGPLSLQPYRENHESAPRNWKDGGERSKRFWYRQSVPSAPKLVELRFSSFFLTELFREHRMSKDWMTPVPGISSDSFHDALHKALLERIYEKCLSGSACVIHNYMEFD